jgi:hypothetical protein
MLKRINFAKDYPKDSYNKIKIHGEKFKKIKTY